MKVRILRDTLIRVKKGAVLEVEEAEGKRLMAFKNAEEAEEAPKKAAKGKK